MPAHQQIPGPLGPVFAAAHRWALPFFAFWSMLIGLFILGLGIFAAVRTARVLLDPVRVEGVVVRVASGTGESGPTAWCRYRDQEGREHETTWGGYGGVGDRLPLVYRAGNPELVVGDTFRSKWLMAVVALPASAATVAVGIYVAIRARRRRSGRPANGSARGGAE